MAGITSLEQVVTMLRKQAHGYIAGRKCTFGAVIERPTDALDDQDILMEMETAHMVQRRSVTHEKGDDLYETLDLGMTMLTHMAVKCGLIETTPKQATHHVTLLGTDWESAELQLDGHTLRGVYQMDYRIRAGEEPKLTLTFSRSRLHLDQEFLPRSMQLEVEGMGRVLELLREAATRREDGFKDAETGKEFALLHSSDDEVAFYREVYEALTLYEAVQDDPTIVEVGESDNVH